MFVSPTHQQRPEIVIAGIRPPRGAMADPQRLMTPEAAIRGGANYLVVGTPMRDAAAPVAAPRAIAAIGTRGRDAVGGEHA